MSRLRTLLAMSYLIWRPVVLRRTAIVVLILLSLEWLIFWAARGTASNPAMGVNFVAPAGAIGAWVPYIVAAGVVLVCSKRDPEGHEAAAVLSGSGDRTAFLLAQTLVSTVLAGVVAALTTGPALLAIGASPLLDNLSLVDWVLAATANTAIAAALGSLIALRWSYVWGAAVAVIGLWAADTASTLASAAEHPGRMINGWTVGHVDPFGFGLLQAVRAILPPHAASYYIASLSQLQSGGVFGALLRFRSSTAHSGSST
jgi:hypothetical protein